MDATKLKHLENHEICQVERIESPRKKEVMLEDINVGNQPKEVIQDVLSVLNTNRNCIAMDINEFGCTNLIEKDINEIPGSVPVQSKPHRTNNEEREKVKEIVTEWKRAGIVTETNSPYASPGSRPFATIHLDHLGPLISSTKQNKYILVIIDNLTKFVKLEPMRNTKANDAVRKMENFVLQYGAPERIISDRGSCFTSNQFQKFCEKHGIKHILNSPRHAQANGQVERVNRTLIPVIQASKDDPEGRDWDKDVKKIERDLNSSINKSTNKSPFELLYGYVPCYEEGEMRHLTLENDAYTNPAILQEQARKRIQLEQMKYKDRYDKAKYRNVSYEVGDIVYMKTIPKLTGESTKLQNKYRGPLVISKVLPHDTYGVADLRADHGTRYATTAHVSQLKMWRPSLDEEVLSSEESDADEEFIDYKSHSEVNREIKKRKEGTEEIG